MSRLKFSFTFSSVAAHCVHTKTWHSPFSTLPFRCIKSEMTVEMCSAPRQLHGRQTHVSTAFDPLATLRGDAEKLLIMWKQLLLKVMCTSETHWWTVNTSLCVQLCAKWCRNIPLTPMTALALLKEILQMAQCEENAYLETERISWHTMTTGSSAALSFQGQSSWNCVRSCGRSWSTTRQGTMRCLCPYRCWPHWAF